MQRHLLFLSLLLSLALTLCVPGCGGSSESGSSSGSSGSSASSGGSGGESSEGGGSDGEFELHSSDDAGEAHGAHPSQIRSTATMAAMRLFVVDPETGPISGIVIKMTGPDGTAYYTDETDSVGYAEVLVPMGRRYEIEYLSLGRRDIAARVTVPEGPNQDIRLTVRHRSWRRRRAAPPPPREDAPAEAPPPAEEEPAGFVLDGVLFATGSAEIEDESFPRLDRLVEYMEHRRSARIRIAGHTDSVGNPEDNRRLSQSRADAVRDYVIAHGIDASRIEAIGYGADQPVAPNDTEEGRARNRRIEAIEL